MRRLLLVLGVLFAMAGSFLGGTRLKSAVLYQQGRLSACKDILNALSPVSPFVQFFQCVPYNGDAALKVGDGLYSLDGTKKLN